MVHAIQHRPIEAASNHRIATKAVEVIRQTVDAKRDMQRYAIGGGELGRMGVTPMEMSATHSKGGIRGRLIDAIDEYVLYHQISQTAGLIRQGIAQR